jgi:hypothetical protein
MNTSAKTNSYLAVLPAAQRIGDKWLAIMEIISYFAPAKTFVT